MGKEERDRKVSIFSLPKDPVRRTAWINSLPNVIEDLTDYMGICEKHWLPNYPTTRINNLPLNSPSVWNVTDSFCKQLKCLDRDVKNRGVDAESRRSVLNTPGRTEVDTDRIQSWESLVNFCRELGLPLNVKEDSIRLFSCHVMPPEIDFSITIDREFTKVQHMCQRVNW